MVSVVLTGHKSSVAQLAPYANQPFSTGLHHIEKKYLHFSIRVQTQYLDTRSQLHPIYPDQKKIAYNAI